MHQTHHPSVSHMRSNPYSHFQSPSAKPTMPPPLRVEQKVSYNNALWVVVSIEPVLRLQSVDHPETQVEPPPLDVQPAWSQDYTHEDVIPLGPEWKIDLRYCGASAPCRTNTPLSGCRHPAFHRAVDGRWACSRIHIAQAYELVRGRAHPHIQLMASRMIERPLPGELNPALPTPSYDWVAPAAASTASSSPASAQAPTKRTAIKTVDPQFFGKRRPPNNDMDESE